MKMKKINSLELTKCLRKQKRIFYLSLIFLLLSLIITYLGYNYENQKLPEALNLKENSIVVDCIGSDMGNVAIVKEKCLTNQQIKLQQLTKYQ